MLTMRDRLIELIEQHSDKRLAKHIPMTSEGLADYLLANGVIVPPCKVGDLPDRVFSHNSIIAIWIDIPNEHYSQRLWRGMAWDIPKQYSEMKFKKIFGTIAENISESDTINILVDLTREEAERALRATDNNVGDKTEKGGVNNGR